MRILTEPNFEIDAPSLKRVKEKFKDCSTDFVETVVRGNRVKFERSVVEKYLKLTEDEAKERVTTLCDHFVQVCESFKIPRKPAAPRVFSDDELRAAAHVSGEVKNFI